VMSMDARSVDTAVNQHPADATGITTSIHSVRDRTESVNWCERRLLARIHRYSREKRRQSGQVVAPASFMRFLLAWHGLDQPTEDVQSALALLEGWSAPVSAWEPELLQARCRNYSAQLLDQLFLSGQLAWFRPAQGAMDRQQLISATPIAIVPRAAISAWISSAPVISDDIPQGAAAILLSLQQQGAMFTEDLLSASSLLQPQLEQNLGLLVARGLITADAYSPLRWLVRPEQQKRRQLRMAGAFRGNASGISSGYSSGRTSGRIGVSTSMLGRWSLFAARQSATSQLQQTDMAQVCMALLRRYGVVFRAILERESLLPPWRDLLRYFRRMEDRGEVLGGRFVDGFSGEQFALVDAVGLLRNIDRQPPHQQLRVIAATDPLNLGGIITPGARTPAINGHRILLQNGLPVARLQGENVEVLDSSVTLCAEQLRQQLSPVRILRQRGS